MPWSTYQIFIILPTGAVSGQRIVLDGNTGLIGVYDVNNNLVGSISATVNKTGNIVTWLSGVSVYSAANKYSIRLTSTDGIAFEAYPDASQFTAGGLIRPSNPAAPGADARPALLFQSPTSDPNQQLLFVGMYSSKTDGTGKQQLLVGGRNGVTGNTIMAEFAMAGFVQAWRNVGTGYSPEIWTAPTFFNGWGNDPTPPRNQPAAFHIHPDGWVSMRGVICCGTNAANTLIMSVPMYYAPLQTEWFALASPATPASFATVRVEPNGNIYLENPATQADICLTGASWATGAPT